jgi:peptide chain release factor subunit 3
MVNRKINGPLMLPISEKYKDMGAIAVGKIESGHMRKGDSLVLMPNKVNVEVAAIYNELEDEISSSICGDNVRVRLRGVEDEDISPGFVLTSPKHPVHAVRQFEAQLAILEHKNIICAGYSAVMHVHTLSEEVTLPVRAISDVAITTHHADIAFQALLHYFDKTTGRKSKKPPQFAKRGELHCFETHSQTNIFYVSGQKIVALIETPLPVCIETFVDYPQLGRFTLRDEGRCGYT